MYMYTCVCVGIVCVIYSAYRLDQVQEIPKLNSKN